MESEKQGDKPLPCTRRFTATQPLRYKTHRCGRVEQKKPGFYLKERSGAGTAKLIGYCRKQKKSGW